MLIRFVVRNFRSINQEAELLMISGKARKHPEHIVQDTRTNGYNLLKTAVLYGANAAGKSNLIEAMRFARQLIVQGIRPQKSIPFQRFRLDPEVSTQPARFEFEFKIGDNAYAYGFELTPERIEAEWLYRLHKTAESTQLFDRTANANPEQGEAAIAINQKALRLSQEDTQFLRFVARGTRPNQLFLSECNERNVPYFADVMTWFRKVLLVLPPPSVEMSAIESYLSVDASTNGSIINQNMVKSLRGFNIDVAGIHLREIQDTETVDIFAKWLDLMQPVSDETQQVVVGGHQNGNGYGRVILRRDATGVVKAYRIVTMHKANDGTDVQFEFNDESDGTIRLIDLLSGFITSLEEERVFVVDELDRSLHPILTYNFVDFFLKSTQGFPNQLIVTTHESGLLDLDLLRRDEIWFVEKNQQGATNLYALEEFMPRHDKDIRRGYLQGRYGAIPVVRKLRELGWE